MFSCFSAIDWEFMSIGDNHYLLQTNSQNGDVTSDDVTLSKDLSRSRSVLFRWQGVDGFVPVHYMLTQHAADWEVFYINGETFIVYANAVHTVSKVFRAKLT